MNLFLPSKFLLNQRCLINQIMMKKWWDFHFVDSGTKAQISIQARVINFPRI
jgi:hypothetical protein